MPAGDQRPSRQWPPADGPELGYRLAARVTVICSP